MQDINKKRVEGEWRRLIARRPDESVKPRLFINPAGAKVIRRRKGKKDLFIDATPVSNHQDEVVQALNKSNSQTDAQ